MEALLVAGIGVGLSSIAGIRAYLPLALVGLFAALGLFVLPEPLGSYVYEKDGFTCYVVVFWLDVTGQLDNYPEAGMRQRLWLPVGQAPTRIEELGLRDVLRGVAGREGAGDGNSSASA